MKGQSGGTSRQICMKFSINHRVFLSLKISLYYKAKTSRDVTFLVNTSPLCQVTKEDAGNYTCQVILNLQEIKKRFVTTIFAGFQCGGPDDLSATNVGHPL